MTTANLLVAMLGLHALADYPLQGDFLARGKNRAAPLMGVPWYQPLAAHAIIHGFMVFVLALLVAPHLALWLFFCEAVAHAVIDDAKCTGKLGQQPLPGTVANGAAFNIDQALHVFCKVLWTIIIVVAG